MKSFETIMLKRLTKICNNTLVIAILTVLQLINLCVFCQLNNKNDRIDLSLVNSNRRNNNGFVEFLHEQSHVLDCDIITSILRAVSLTDAAIFSNGQFPPNCLLSHESLENSESNSFSPPGEEIKKFFISWQSCSSLETYPFIETENLPNKSSPAKSSKSESKILIAIFCDESQTEKLFLNFTLHHSTMYVWLISMEMPFLERFNFLEGITLCSHILTIIVHANKTADIHDLYKLGNSIEAGVKGIQTPRILTIEPNSNLTWFLDSPLFSEKSRSDMQLYDLRVAGVKSLEYSYDTDIVQDPKTLQFSFQNSFAAEVLFSLELTMNFKMVPKVVNAWGHLENGNWTGMISLLIENKADIGISSLADRPFRREVVDFNMPTNALRLSAFFRRPSTVTQSNALIAPFKKDLWIGLLCWCWMITLILQILRRLIIAYEPICFKEKYIWNFSESVQWTLGTICLQGVVDIPTLFCYRIIVTIGSLAGFVIYTAYAGTLFSFLSVTVESITSLQQLLKTDYKFSVVDSALPVQFLSESPSPTEREIIKRRWVDPIYGSMSQASSKISKGSFVFICDHLSGYTSLNSESDFSIESACRIKELSIPHGEQQQGTIVQKNSPYKRIIDYQILRMWEYGLVKHWNKRYIHSKPNCGDSIKHQGVHMQSVILAFATVAAGMLFSVVFVILEIFYCFAKQRVERRLVFRQFPIHAMY